MGHDIWNAANAYEAYIGRWSSAVARRFVEWLQPAPYLRWLDVGCGTGALSAAILAVTEPQEVLGVDPSAAFLQAARARLGDVRADFRLGDAQALDLPDGRFDLVVIGLALNFVPRPDLAVRECARLAGPGHAVAAYVWDYAEGMQLIRSFWDAAGELDPQAIELDEARRFPICTPERLRALFTEGHLERVEVIAIDVPTVFADFADLWRPFLGGQGPAPGYVASLSPERQSALGELLRARLPAEADGSIHLSARAWAIRGWA